jgi:hypothetical protein
MKSMKLYGISKIDYKFIFGDQAQANRVSNVLVL